MSFDVETVRKDFPILTREVHGVPLVYLDSANTSQKPQVVLDTLADFYARHNANVARAVHTLGSEATTAFENARDTVARFVNAPRREEVVFTKNSSEALNLVAYTFSNAATFPGAERFRLGPGDEIVATEMEHHSNLVPWQLLAQRTGATFRWLPIDDDGRLVESAIDEVIGERTKVVAFVHQSNALGTVNPVQRIAARAREVGALSVLDASQSAPHLPLDVQDLGVDFVAFTGHKLYGPTGVGVLWGRYELLADLPPFLGGGEMIETVDMTGTTFAAPPHRFEAGTPMIAQAVGLAAAIDYVSALGMTDIAAHEHELVEYALGQLRGVDGLRIIGPDTAEQRGATIAFTLRGVHPHDAAQLLDERGVAVRAGHHCARPVCVRYGIPATTRASFGIYTTTAEIDALVSGLQHVAEVFAA
jgi:cysteine desulfurase/selenocysteine lyase